MQPLHPHPLPRQNYRERSGCSHPSTHSSPTQPRLHALISRPQTLPHARLQRNYFRPCEEPGFHNSQLPLPRAIPGEPGSRGYNLRGKGPSPSNCIPPMPTLCCAVFQQSHSRQERGLFCYGTCHHVPSQALAPSALYD